ncbi:MAG: sigma-54 dependent transcriptional regulator [Candidatus Marinimicrobia bacterium]|nr:sigma-54 dependent transcriptional regulator [Candidatus Neomarinimicrobiota bacterium]MCF7829112.1 sigma-54 dependent transcriptional regulator [Candidatus Neomarinimicrobiota bacterium]MCF7881489.1 sigma-54 dependent transcriptional regulator [Candidatus Neomarinimicrobiota bacterium]
MAVLYIIDDEVQICDMLTTLFQDKSDLEVLTFQSAPAALEHLSSVAPDVVISDYYMPEMNGMKFLQALTRESPETELIMITGYGDQDTAVEALEKGAYDYLKKPLNLKEVLLVVERALQSKQKEDRLSYMYSQQRKMRGFGKMVGSSPEMQRVFKMIRTMGDAGDSPAVIHGEIGTGREMVARTIHDNGKRKQQNFVDVACGALLEDQFELELFGSEKKVGGKHPEPQRGLIEVANGGTLFLDEVGGLSLKNQAKILKVMEEKSFRRIGGEKKIPLDVRIIASTSESLESLAEQGQMLESLYYGLNVISITVPPLRDRGDDVLLLADFFIDEFNREFNFNVTGITPEAQSLLKKHDWPGNVRELRNIIERSVLLKKTGDIDTHHLTLIPSSLRNNGPQSESGLHIYLPEDGIDFEALEKKYLETALKRTNGNKSKAARLLGMSRSTFRYRIEKFFTDAELDTLQ